MKEYLKMSDVFKGELFIDCDCDDVIVDELSLTVLESFSGADAAKFALHAINSHDELVAEVERLRELDKSKLLLQYRSDLSNWVRLSDLHNVFSQFSRPQLKMLFWKRDERKGLNECCKMLGKYMYVNTKIFSLWLSGELDQKKTKGHKAPFSCVKHCQFQPDGAGDCYHAFEELCARIDVHNLEFTSRNDNRNADRCVNRSNASNLLCSGASSVNQSGKRSSRVIMKQQILIAGDGYGVTCRER